METSLPKPQLITGSTEAHREPKNALNPQKNCPYNFFAQPATVATMLFIKTSEQAYVGTDVLGMKCSLL